MPRLTWPRRERQDARLGDDDELAAGATGGGRIRHSWELIQFKTATLVSGNIYTLTGLLRGLRGTARFMGAHVFGESFVKLNNLAGIQNVGVDTAAVGLEYLYRVLNPDGISGAIIPFKTQGVGLKPLPPADAVGTATPRGSRHLLEALRPPSSRPGPAGLHRGRAVLRSATILEVDIIHPLFGFALRDRSQR
jgi:hypothetical protein